MCSQLLLSAFRSRHTAAVDLCRRRERDAPASSTTVARLRFFLSRGRGHVHFSRFALVQARRPSSRTTDTLTGRSKSYYDGRFFSRRTSLSQVFRYSMIYWNPFENPITLNSVLLSIENSINTKIKRLKNT